MWGRRPGRAKKLLAASFWPEAEKIVIHWLQTTLASAVDGWQLVAISVAYKANSGFRGEGLGAGK
jgi:hypothetical protein